MRLLPQDLAHHSVTNDVGETIQHLFEPETIRAINAAIAINRPLLIWGEPGIGKSQLARAAAQALGRVFIPFVADAHTESHDLLWQFDAVARLAEAQIQSAAEHDRTLLAMEHFIVPGPLWWAFNWTNAEELIHAENAAKQRICHREAPPVQKGCSIKNGAVVLIDEIDKAGSDVPNGLLEALGNSRFQPRGLNQPVECSGERPLIMITTNEERSLPDAFMRRCLSLHLAFPEAEAQVNFLVKRARLNFPELDKQRYRELDDQTILEAAAAMLTSDREQAQARRFYPLPGQAEYFDLLRGIKHLSGETGQSPVDLIQQLRVYVYQKHPGFHRRKG